MKTILLSLYIAIRFIHGNKRNKVISCISFISIISISLGVAILIVGLSAMNGFEKELNQKILSVFPHGEIEVVHPPFIGWEKILDRIERVPEVIAAAPYVNFTGLIEYRNKLQIIQIKGINVKKEEKISTFINFVKNCSWKNFENGKKQIIIGKGIADIFNLHNGDWINILIQNTDFKKKTLQPKRIRLQINGILQLSSRYLDRNFAVIPLQDAQLYQHFGKNISGIAIKFKNALDANKLLYKVGQFINRFIYIKSWTYTYGYIYRDIQMVRLIMYISMMLIIGISCFNIASNLTMVIKDKIFDIAILRTFGAKENLFNMIFIWYGLFSGLIGALIGTVIGIFISLHITELVKIVESFLKYKILLSNIYYVDFVPSELHLSDLIFTVLITLLFSLLASLYPANRIKLLNPVEILKNKK